MLIFCDRSAYRKISELYGIGSFRLAPCQLRRHCRHCRRRRRRRRHRPPPPPHLPRRRLLARPPSLNSICRRRISRPLNRR